MTLTDLCERLRNWFDVNRHIGTFEIKDGTIDLDFIRGGQFYRLVGTKSYDGVVYATNKGNGLKIYYVMGVVENGDFELISLENDEVFTGAIWELSFPLAFVLKYREMGQWETVNKKALDSPYQSESFGGYNRSMRSSDELNWEMHFKSDLARWQKL